MLSAAIFLEDAIKAIGDRASSRDTAQERSMKATVDAFNALYGQNITEDQGWGFMILLKLVRGNQGRFRADDFVDAAAYAALLGESASREAAPEKLENNGQDYKS
jgi:hypothetical protein